MVSLTDKSGKYILFTGEVHERVKFDFTIGQVNKFIELWNQGKAVSFIAKQVGCSQVSIVLLLIDLEMAGKIEPRPGGMFGNAS